MNSFLILKTLDETLFRFSSQSPGNNKPAHRRRSHYSDLAQDMGIHLDQPAR